MKPLNQYTTIEELLDVTEEIVGENKECEKNLLMSIMTLLITFHKPEEKTWETVVTLLLDTYVPKGPKNPQSQLDMRFEKVPNSMALTYYRAYKLYPDHSAASAAGNLVYKILKLIKTQNRE